MSRAISNVFLTVHGVQGEQTPGQAQRRDHGLGGRNLVALLGDRQMAKNDLPVGGKGAQYMRRLAVVEGVEAAAQGLRYPISALIYAIPAEQSAEDCHKQFSCAISTY